MLDHFIAKNATAHKVNSYYTLAISYCTFCVGKRTILGPGRSDWSVECCFVRTWRCSRAPRHIQSTYLYVWIYASEGGSKSLALVWPVVPRRLAVRPATEHSNATPTKVTYTVQHKTHRIFCHNFYNTW